MTDHGSALATRYSERLPDWVAPDPRQGYEGVIIPADRLVEFAFLLRDELGYDLLSSVTGVDYLPEGKMEVVYHALQTIGGAPFVFKVQVPRENPVVPSVVPVWPGADFQEREAWDLLGIRFEGHPDLRRILMWEGFEGHPLRKDWKEPYYEEEAKPYKSRWPEGHVRRAEDVAPLHDNVQYPAGFDPESWTPDGDEALYRGFREYLDDSGSELKTDRLIVNLGPQHPSTHGVFRMVVVLDGETIVDLKPVFGYLHRNHEKIGERCTWIQNMPFTDRLDYISSMSNNFGYALAVEKLMGIKPPERAEYIRVMMAELTRIVSHLIAVGFLLNDLGAFFTPVLYALEERELILDIFEAVSGSRMMCNYFRFGGVARDLPEGVLERVRDLVENRLPRKIDEIDRYLTKNEIVRTRCEGVGVLTAERAIALSATGPVLRASGVPYDLRRADPYSIYDRFEFDVAVRYHGDIYDRYLIRLDEIRQSIRILKQVLRDIPEGPIISGKPQWQVRVPAGESYGRVEGPKGELGFYVVSNGKPNPWRYHVRAPSFINLHTLAEMARGGKVADVVVILGSIDIVLGEVDPIGGDMNGMGVLKGLAVTFRHFIDTYLEDLKAGKKRYFTAEGIRQRSSVEAKGIFSIQYPEEKLPVPEEFRYIPFLVYDEGEGGEKALRCTSCGICAKVCPPQCIWIVRTNDPVTGKPVPAPAEFYIDVDICMNCGYCAEYCPFDAIKMDHDYEIASYDRFKEHIFDLNKLSKPASYYAKIRPVNFAREAAEREAKAAKKAAA